MFERLIELHAAMQADGIVVRGLELLLVQVECQIGNKAHGHSMKQRFLIAAMSSRSEWRKKI